jgi:2-polyprenyl-3-methyl-5-hydroxy-6-metoxy-1,4-benzoquinol methylase
MYERLDNCPVCGSPQFTNLMICQDKTVTQESFAIVECKKCRLKFTNPRPTENNVSKYYKSETYISHSDTKKGIINQVYHLVRKYTLRQKLNLINSLQSKEKKLLDIGCGTGTFLETCKKAGWKVAGTEPDPETRQVAIKKTKVAIEENILDSFSGSTFDVITMWHVLEHIHQLDGVVARLKKLLTPGGTLIVAVPNCESYDAKMFKEQWAAYDVPRHLYHFTQSTIKTLFQKHKMKVEKILPMKFDAYYVSLLSFQYKEGKANFLEAFKVGYASNKWAGQHENNYSSLIFIIKQ